MRDTVNQRLFAIAILLTAALGCSSAVHTTPPQTPAAPTQDHIAWVAATLARMETVKVGMTRNDLVKVFRGEGGFQSVLQQTVVSRDCPYFKVDVEFEAVGRPSRTPDGRGTIVEGPQDRIIKISTPYLGYMVIN